VVLNLIFLGEWNNSAVAVILGLFFAATLIPFFLLWGLLKVIPETNKFIERLWAKHKFFYFLFLFLLFLVSIIAVFLFSSYLNNP
jgi:hypothetical protein